MFPNIGVSHSDEMLHPVSISDGGSLDTDATQVLDVAKTEGIVYLHSKVVRSRDRVCSGNEPISTFLAEIDLPPRLRGFVDPQIARAPARLVLGLNNHHVGSYYWARSAGAGGSMEAPGILFDASDDSIGLLRWEEYGEPTACNSNDGKRSKWVNFLRPGDTIQLLPADANECINKLTDVDGKNRVGAPTRIFGVTSKRRPLGSEPEIVCEWIR